MISGQASKPRAVNVVDTHERQRIFDFLQGAVYCWCKNRSDERFAAKDLVGGENNDWSNTPLQRLYEKLNETKSDEDAFDQAGKDIGTLLYSVIYEDERTFDVTDQWKGKEYKWKQ